MRKHRIASRRAVIWTASGATLLAITAIVVFMYSQKNTTPTPLHGAALATYNLIKTTQQLQESFSSPDNKPKSTTTDYLSHMDAIQLNCKNIRQYVSDAKNTGLPAESKQLLSSSVSLCDDLEPLAKDSQHIYSTIRPVLSADTQIKRYQTIPFIKNRTRDNLQSGIESAISTLSSSAKTNKEYTSSAPPLLQSLQSTFNNSAGFGYTTALQNFQRQMLAERQQYWTGYAGLSNLQAALGSQLRSYCQTAALQDSIPKVCKSTKD